jgi:hypothetical protein
MAAVIVPTTAPRRSPGRVPARPPLQVIPGGRRAARQHARAWRRASPLPASVYRRRRLGALLVVASLVLVAYLGVGALLSSPGGAAGPSRAAGAAAHQVYVVQPGDTLWSIARSLHPHGDIRSVVDRLEARTGGAVLQPGQSVSLDGLTS